jgi:hypothetical protein
MNASHFVPRVILSEVFSDGSGIVMLVEVCGYSWRVNHVPGRAPTVSPVDACRLSAALRNRAIKIVTTIANDLLAAQPPEWHAAGLALMAA